jgi:phosphoglycerate dehydrogenase-like enzyme
MALLALNARLPTLVWNQRQSQWQQIFTPLIRGKMLAVVGLGDLGRAAVEAGRMLGMKVIGVRRSGKKVPGVDRVFRPAQLVSALRNADFIVVATPMTPATEHLLDRDVLRRTKPGVGIVNIGRARTIDYTALAALLRSGHVSGAVLDVFSPEPLPSSSELWSTPNLIISPHVSSDDRDGYMLATMDLVCGNLRRLLARRPLENVVVPARGY